MSILGLLLAVLVGLSVSLLGGGGAILAVPIFFYVLSFDTKEAVASSLAVVGVTSFAGAYLVRFVPQVTLRKVFAVFLILVATFILYQYLGEFF
jgi:uncharacterized membrane protein YfcA